MRRFRFAQLSLLWKILLSTSVAITLLFAATGWIVLEDAIRTTSESVDHEVQASFQAYQSLWKSRADLLSSASALLSTMSDVRAAFGTGDAATIRDTARELWSRISDQDAIFLVTDPRGRVIASIAGGASSPAPAGRTGCGARSRAALSPPGLGISRARRAPLSPHHHSGVRPLFYRRPRPAGRAGRRL